MTLRKKQFRQQFKPLGMKKHRTFFVSVPAASAQAMATISFLGGLKTWGQTIMLVPQFVHYLYYWLPERSYTKLVYAKPTRSFGKEMKMLRQRLQGHKIHFLIELNEPVNISLPDLVKTDKRICFFNMENYPYYNIMIKDGFTSLREFFNLEEMNPTKVLRFAGRNKNQVRAAYGKRKPLCFVNGKQPTEWQGDTIILDQDVPAAHPDVLCLLHAADAYCGCRDTLYEFANAFKKKIIDQ